MTTKSTPQVFFAYSSVPASCGEVVRDAVDELNRGGLAEVTGWETLRIGGQILADTICRLIARSELFCADVTTVNPNVLFELGYAIAQRKRVWLIVDDGLSRARKDFEQLRTLTTVGFRPYANSHDVVAAFYKDRPYADDHPTIFASAIEPTLEPDEPETLLYLKSLYDTQASVRVTRRIEATALPTAIHDPKEAGSQPLSWYGKRVFGALGVLVHLTPSDREGAAIHNARAGLVAGLAHGLQKPLLLLSGDSVLEPIDYRDLSRRYGNAAAADEHVEQWLSPILRSYDAAARRPFAAVKLSAELNRLKLGEHIAENEAAALPEYFVETGTYRELINARQIILVGRKGSGKTAALLEATAELAHDTRNLVCVMKPLSYELEGVLRLLRTYKARDSRGYVMESLWKYLLMTEIARTAAQRIADRVDRGIIIPTAAEKELLELTSSHGAAAEGDFSIRVERAVEGLLSVRLHDSVEAERVAIAEALHRGPLARLRSLLGDVLQDRERVAVLVDNLDKAWDRRADIELLSEFLLGLLSAQERLTTDFRKDASSRKPVNVSLAVFLRSDIFNQVRGTAREPDKIGYSRLTWTDRDTLFRVLEERFRHTRRGRPEDPWAIYFTPRVGSTPTKDYIHMRILPRPRDLIYFVKAAISTAVSRGHTSVEEADIQSADREYSRFAVDTFLVESVGFDVNLDMVLYEFAGCDQVLGEAQVEEILASANVPPEMLSATIDRLLKDSFLGIEVNDGKFEYGFDDDDIRLKLVRNRRFIERTGAPRRFAVHAAFRPFLETTELLF
jgi:hypothetical protein